MEVIEGGFKQGTNTIHQLQDDILDAIEKYSGKVTVAAVIGVLEIIKFDLLADVEEEQRDGGGENTFFLPHVGSCCGGTGGVYLLCVHNS